MYAFIQRINVNIIRRSILKATRKLQFTQTVVINAWNPQIGVFLYQKLNEKLNVYYCFDEISVGPWTKEHGVYSEKHFLQMADACIVSSLGLYQTKAPITKRCFVVCNGVNFDVFRSGYSFPKEQPVVIGFIGMIASRIDFVILEAIVRHFPKATLMLVGGIAFDGRSVDEEVAQLKTHANVMFTGAQPSEKLPQYLKSFHIGIIPNVKNTQTAAVYPLKINEYMAAGIPVVTTDFAPMDEFAGYITVARSTAGFIQGIEQELATDNDQKRQARQEIARQNSWDNRALAFERIISN
jgi:glycosyltransferase involved in cell wall biosynthesis